MSVLRKFAAVVMAVLLMVVGTATASAATETVDRSRALQSCYGGAVSYKTMGIHLPSSTGYYRTTSRCNDINLRLDQGSDSVSAIVCFRRTGACNNAKTVKLGGGWHVIATDVLDGTDFRVQIKGNRTGNVGKVAF
ncbi:hypothetical protein [Actinoalloteichus hymeniacidonis]|uniref:Secreted protein n=1 Tax=Actinoalloteichus hymeniacidonis TaxID=340345 RepID=A0AAC9HRX0_9PSEU|nr:hypothetical protein [Actinoalloteichus hymeniacidonis]AOS64091.1 hypothetical protein TL08_16455 [Actinoalloteichus hymeniacidonis]MBB5907844.1 hypothetical protein [Actinoalloteichus hymeniacidonis]